MTKKVSESSKLLDNHVEMKVLEETAITEIQTGTLCKSVRNSILGPSLLWTDRFKPGNIPVTLMFVAIAFSTALLTVLLFDFENIEKWWYIVLIILLGVAVIFCLVFMMMFKQDDNIKTYKVIIQSFFEI